MVLKSFISMLSRFSQVIMPLPCLFCLKANGHKIYAICAACYHDLPFLGHHCHRCAQALLYSKEVICGQCLAKSPPFANSHAVFSYEFPIIALIKRLKYQQQLPIAKALGYLMANQIQQQWYKHKTLPQLVLPVPLHPKRMQERGFNQSLEIAKAIAHLLPITIDTVNCRRLKYTLAQSGLSAKKRHCNLKHAFTVQNNYQNTHIAILDDVMTTGHTVRSVATTLKQYGAGQIDVWCIARA
jgi:ComF family protein